MAKHQVIPFYSLFFHMEPEIFDINWKEAVYLRKDPITTTRALGYIIRAHLMALKSYRPFADIKGLSEAA